MRSGTKKRGSAKATYDGKHSGPHRETTPKTREYTRRIRQRRGMNSYSGPFADLSAFNELLYLAGAPQKNSCASAGDT